MTKPIITVRGISKQYNIGIQRNGTKRGGLKDALLSPFRMLHSFSQPFLQNDKNAFWALKDITFDVYHGEKIGIIGLNGAGKSTLLKILSRLVYPTEGEVRICGRVTSLLEIGTGFNPNLSGRKNIYLNASLCGLERSEIDSKFNDIVEFSGIGKFLDTPVKYYSSGMYMRLAFSVAAHLDPDILLLDEVLAVGDLSFQQKCLKRVEGLASGGRTILFVSHSMDAVSRFCDRCIWMENGKIMLDGEVEKVVAAYAENVFNVTAVYQSHDQESEPSKSAEQQQIVTDTKEEQTIKKSADTDAIAAEGKADKEDVAKYAQLISARVINRKKESVSVVPVDECAGIELIYDVYQTDKILVPAIGLVDSKDNIVFWAVDSDSNHLGEIRVAGRHISTVWFPDNFLNEGHYYINLAMATPDTTPQERHFFIEKALSFYSTESKDFENTARGIMPRTFPGSLRPKLSWEHQ